jgi:hypothetical protein
MAQGIRGAVGDRQLMTYHPQGGSASDCVLVLDDAARRFPLEIGGSRIAELPLPASPPEPARKAAGTNFASATSDSPTPRLLRAPAY